MTHKLPLLLGAAASPQIALELPPEVPLWVRVLASLAVMGLAWAAEPARAAVVGYLRGWVDARRRKQARAIEAARETPDPSDDDAAEQAAASSRPLLRAVDDAADALDNKGPKK